MITIPAFCWHGEQPQHNPLSGQVSTTGDPSVRDHRGFSGGHSLLLLPRIIRRDEMASKCLGLFRHASCQFSDHILADWGRWSLTGSCSGNSFSISCSLFATSKGSHSSHTETCEKMLRFWQDSQVPYPCEEMLVSSRTLNASVPLLSFSCKEPGVGFAIHPSLVKTTFHVST